MIGPAAGARARALFGFFSANRLCVTGNWGLNHRAARSSSSRRASRALRYGRPYLCPTGRAPSNQLSWCWCSAPPSKPPAAEMAGGATSAAPRRPCSPAQLRMRNRSHHSARPHQWQAGSAPRRYWDWQSHNSERLESIPRHFSFKGARSKALNRHPNWDSNSRHRSNSLSTDR